MISFKRRQLVAGMGAAFATGTLGSIAHAAMGPDDKFDLVIQGGEVIDPSQGLRGKRDIGMRYGRIEAIEADIPAARAQRVLNAAGRIVVPGLIDLHAHVFTTGIGIPADELVLYQGTTTAVSAGDAGASTFATYRRYATAQSRTRIFAFVHIANISSTVSTPPMWHITRPCVPASSQARIARLSGSMPCRAITFCDMRTLMPMAMSAFSASVFAAASVCAKSMLNSSPTGNPARPMLAMCTNA